MGAWGPGVFENDDACDFAAEVAKDRDLSRLQQTFDRVRVTGDEYLEAPDGSVALAAAVIVARLRGHWGQRDAYTANVDLWAQRIGLAPSSALVLQAQQSVERVMTEPSELLELWSEDDPAAFTQVVQELLQRLELAAR